MRQSTPGMTGVAWLPPRPQSAIGATPRRLGAADGRRHESRLALGGVHRGNPGVGLCGPDGTDGFPRVGGLVHGAACGCRQAAGSLQAFSKRRAAMSVRVPVVAVIGQVTIVLEDGSVLMLQ